MKLADPRIREIKKVLERNIGFEVIGIIKGGIGINRGVCFNLSGSPCGINDSESMRAVIQEKVNPFLEKNFSQKFEIEALYSSQEDSIFVVAFL